MGLLTSILTFPYAPVRLVTSVAKVLHQQAETELYSSTNVRRQLEGLDEAAATGEISESERLEGQQAILSRLTARPGPGPEPPPQR